MTPQLARIRVYPVKSLDPMDLERVDLVAGRRLAGDRDYALFDAAGRFVNGKRCGASLLGIRAEYSDGGRSIALSAGEDRAQFDLRHGHAELEAWFGLVLGKPVSLRRNDVAGYPDDEQASGPTVLGSASVDAIAGWFEMPAEEVRRRFRANLEIAGLEPFEEDLLFGPPGRPRRFRIGAVEFLGTNPCARCAVPTLDSRDGSAAGPLTAKRFAALRERHRRPDSDIALYDGYYRLAVNTRLANGQQGKALCVGDELVLGD